MGGNEFLTQNLTPILNILSRVLHISSANREDTHLISLRTTELLIRLHPKEVPPLLSDVLEGVFYLLLTYPETEDQTRELVIRQFYIYLKHFMLFYVILFYFISFHFISFHFIYFILCYLCYFIE